METEKVAKILKELGHPARLRIYKQVARAGMKGISVGDIQASLNIPASTLSHHIATLAQVELLCQRREGRILYCTPGCDTLDKVVEYLTSECCVGEDLSKKL